MNQEKHIKVDISHQTLSLLDGDDVIKEYQVSTAKNGAGEQMNSECTPRGQHIISEKIGAGFEADSVFVGRQATGELYRPELYGQFPNRDWILTRILWLSGCEQDRNKGGNVDSHDRYIYIHGSPDNIAMGTPGSRGCVRMRNRDIIELFDKVIKGTVVEIIEV